MDIHLSAMYEGKSYGLCIENKPSAIDQKNQLRDYAEEMKKRHPERWHLIYLAGYATTPSESSLSIKEQTEYEEQRRLSVIRYVDLVDWLRVCTTQSQNERVCLFLEEFIRYIQKRFAGINMSEVEAVKKLIIEDENSIEAAFQIKKSIDAAQKELLKQLKEQLLEACNNQTRNWELTYKLSSKKFANILISFNIDQNNFIFGALFCQSDYREFAIGVRYLSGSTKIVDGVDLKSQITRIIAEQYSHELVKPTDAWAARIYLKDGVGDWSNNAKPWKMIRNGDMCKLIINYAEQIYNILYNNSEIRTSLNLLENAQLIVSTE